MHHLFSRLTVVNMNFEVAFPVLIRTVISTTKKLATIFRHLSAIASMTVTVMYQIKQPDVIYSSRTCSFINILCCSWNNIPIIQSLPSDFKALGLWLVAEDVVLGPTKDVDPETVSNKQAQHIALLQLFLMSFRMIAHLDWTLIRGKSYGR